jgi:predicted metal-dependent hydrolase
MILEGIDIIIEKTARRKTVSIFIERDGSVKVLAPASVDDKLIEAAVTAKQYQLFSKLAKWKELNSGKIDRQYVNGQSFLYFGRNYILNIVDEQDVPLKISGGKFNIDRRYLDKAETIFKHFYKEKGLEKIKERLPLIESKFNKRPASVKVQELQNRWASCTATGTLNFNWKCAMAPVAVLDYIITHEMVHLIHPNHSPAFWDELDKVMPKYREYDAWLKRNGVKMNL